MIGKSAKGWKTEACDLVLYEVCEGELGVCFSLPPLDEACEGRGGDVVIYIYILIGKLQKYHTFLEYFQKCHPHISKIPHRYVRTPEARLVHPGSWVHQPRSRP